MVYDANNTHTLRRIIRKQEQKIDRLENKIRQLDRLLQEFPAVPGDDNWTADEVVVWLEKVNDWKLRVRDMQQHERQHEEEEF